MLDVSRDVAAARARCRWRGDVRPDFAHAEAEGEESVWDYPRPPAATPEWRLVQVYADNRLVADTQQAMRLLETGNPPYLYVPPDDVEWEWLVDSGADCDSIWLGRGTWYDLVIDGERIERVAWSYQRVYPEYVDLQGWVAFHPARLTCRLDGETVYPQPGDGGGWVTRGIIGPFKGAPGTEDW
jgi:uncharacterized protein (DUF427 family)